MTAPAQRGPRLEPLTGLADHVRKAAPIGRGLHGPRLEPLTGLADLVQKAAALTGPAPRGQRVAAGPRMVQTGEPAGHVRLAVEIAAALAGHRARVDSGPVPPQGETSAGRRVVTSRLPQPGEQAARVATTGL